MPYEIDPNNRKCIRKADSKKRVGCTKGSVKKYLGALHANVHESMSITNSMFHTSIIQNRDSIKTNGLNSSGVTPWPEDEYPKGTYLWDTLKSALKYGFGNGDPFDVWKINIRGYDVKQDPITKNAFYIEENISPEDIQLIESHENDVTNPVISESEDDFEWAKEIVSRPPLEFKGKEFLIDVRDLNSEERETLVNILKEYAIDGAIDTSELSWGNDCFERKEYLKERTKSISIHCGIEDNEYKPLNGAICCLKTTYEEEHNKEDITPIDGRTLLQYSNLNESEDDFEWAKEIVSGLDDYKTLVDVNTAFRVSGEEKEKNKENTLNLPDDAFLKITGEQDGISFYKQECKIVNNRRGSIEYLLVFPEELEGDEGNTHCGDFTDREKGVCHCREEEYGRCWWVPLSDMSQVLYYPNRRGFMNESEEDEFEWAKDVIKDKLKLGYLWENDLLQIGDVIALYGNVMSSNSNRETTLIYTLNGEHFKVSEKNGGVNRSLILEWLTPVEERPDKWKTTAGWDSNPRSFEMDAHTIRDGDGELDVEFINRDRENITESEEDEFDWARQLVDEPIKDVVEGQYYRCDGSIASEPFSHNVYIFVKKIDGYNVIFDAISDAPDPEERENDYSVNDEVDLDRAKELVSTGYWVPVRKENTLFNENINESEGDDFDWVKDVMPGKNGELKGKAWTLVLPGSVEDFEDAQMWAFGEGYRWSTSGTELVDLSGDIKYKHFCRISSIFDSDIQRSRLTYGGSNYGCDNTIEELIKLGKTSTKQDSVIILKWNPTKKEPIFVDVVSLIEKKITESEDDFEWTKTIDHSQYLKVGQVFRENLFARKEYFFEIIDIREGSIKCEGFSWKNPDDKRVYNVRYDTFLRLLNKEMWTPLDIPLNESKEIITEGRYDSITRKVVKDIMDAVKDSTSKKDVSLPNDIRDEEYQYINDNLAFGVELSISFEKVEGFDVNASISNDEDEDIIMVSIKINPTLIPNIYEELFYKLQETVRHEIQHLTQYGVGKTANMKTTFGHHKNKFEVPALVHGFYRRAKLERRPLDDVMMEDLDSEIEKGNLTKTQAETLLKMWIEYAKKNLPAAIYSKE